MTIDSLWYDTLLTTFRSRKDLKKAFRCDLATDEIKYPFGLAANEIKYLFGLAAQLDKLHKHNQL